MFKHLFKLSYLFRVERSKSGAHSCQRGSVMECCATPWRLWRAVFFFMKIYFIVRKLTFKKYSSTFHCHYNSVEFEHCISAQEFFLTFDFVGVLWKVKPFLITFKKLLSDYSPASMSHLQQFCQNHQNYLPNKIKRKTIYYFWL